MPIKIIQAAQSFAIVPLFAFGNGSAIISTTLAPVVDEAKNAIVITIEDIRLKRAKMIDQYYGKHNLPLEGYGMKMVLESEKNGLDWRLLAAIAMRETTGGKFACHQNPFGWGSCKIKFKNFDEAIETVARNLGGGNPATEMYYKGKTTAEKLHYYNGTVIETYVAEVTRIMNKISDLAS